MPVKCSLCNVNKATVTLKHMVDGAVQDLRVCESCAAKHGFNAQLPLPLLTDFLFGVGSPVERADEDDRACPACHMHRGDFHKTSLLGCPVCYESFRSDIELLLENMHKGTRHFGKVPASAMGRYCDDLRREIERADRSDDGDRAESLRRRLRELEDDSIRRPRGRRRAGMDVPRE